jgi:hypothetical protein
MYTVEEVDEYQLVCFEVLFGHVDGRELEIYYTVLSGTATTSDYYAASGRVTITDDIPIQCVSIHIRRDQSRQRRYECFTFRITAVGHIDGLIVEPSEAQICIIGTNSIPITIGMRQSLYYVDESAGSVLVCSRVLSGRTATRSIYMEIYTVPGDAKDGEDYTHMYRSDAITDTDSSDCIRVPILSDSIDEEEECFTVTLTTSTSLPGLTLKPEISTVCIIDDDPTYVTIGLQNTAYSVYETDEYLVVCGEVITGDIAGRMIVVDYITTSDTALSSSDFTAQNNTYQFSSNVLLQCIPIGITSDSVDEPGQECFTFSISSQRSIPGLTISPSEAQICISDFEVKVLPEPTVRLQNNYYTVGENDGGVEVCAEVTTDQFEGTVQANYMTTGGSAKASEDFRHQSGILTFSSNVTTSCVSIQIVNDSVRESVPECFTVSIVSATGDTDSPSVTTVCINDDDALPVTIGMQQTAYTVGEVDNYQLVCLGVLSGDIDGREIVITYTTGSGTADTNDYSWTRGQLTITEDVQFQCVSIPIRNDNVRESSYEYFAFQISAASLFDGLSLEPSVARVYIIDRDSIPVTIGLRQRLYYVDEDSGPVVVCYDVLSGRTATRSIYTELRTVQGDATDGEDYTYTYRNDVISDSDSSDCITIPIISDSTDEEEECFTASLSTTTSLQGLVLNPQIATVCIVDEDITHVGIGLEETEYSAPETAIYHVICARVKSGSIAGREIEILYVVADTDESAVQNGTLLFTEDATVQCMAVSLPPVTSGLPGGESCLSLRLSVTSIVGGLILSPDLATLCVFSTADVPLTIGLQQGYYSVREDGSTIQVCVEIESGYIAGRSISLNYTTLEGSAQAPSDYIDTSGKITITDSDSLPCVSVVINDDSEDEEDRECFVFTISTTAMSGISLETSLATICITDDDDTLVKIGLQQTSYAVTESNSIVLVCTAVESGSIAGRTITIDYQTVNGDAQALSDYSSVSGNFDMTDSNTVQCIPITIISDSTTETSDECFTYTISATSSVAGLTLSSTTATICISDEEEFTVNIGLQQLYYSAVEGQGSVEVCIAVLTGDVTDSSYTISYTTIDGLAEAPTDYVIQSGSLTISETNTTGCVSISIISDEIAEPDMECFIVSFSSTYSYIILAPSVATICINEGPRAVLSLQTPVVIEGRMAQACLSLTRLDRLSQSASITLSTMSTSSTATAGTDYVSASERFTFDSSVSTKQVCLSIATLEDELVEDSETIVIAATGVRGIAVSGSPATLEVNSREFAFYQFVENIYAVRENVSTVQLSVELASSSGMLLNDITLFVSTVGGSASSSFDYQPLVLIPLVFPAGSRAGDTQSFSVSIVDDAEVEGNEQFSITITDSTTTAQSVSLRNMATIAIIDNDFEVNVGFSSLQFTAEEGVSLLEVCLRVFGPAVLSQASLVRVQTIPGSAEASSDYALLDTVVIFPVGASDGDRQCINVTILQDDVVEGTEIFFLQASSVHEVLSLIVIDPSSSLTTVSIADSAMVNFQIVFPASVREDVGSVDVCIEQMNGELNKAIEITVQTSLIGTTATASDYEPYTFILTFTPGIRGPQSICGNIQIIDDILVEEDETIEVTASFEQSEPEITLIRNTASTTILDNDYVLYAWENPEYKVVEDTGSLAVNLCLVSESGTLTFPVDISVTSTAISATEGEDYIHVSDSLLMESGFTAGACTPLIVSIIKDGVLESDETFQLLTDAIGPAMPSSSNGGTTRITIVDDDSICQQELDAFRSASNNCTKSSTSAAQVGGGVVGGLIAGVLLTLVLAVIMLSIIGWRCTPRKQKGMNDDGTTGMSSHIYEESSKL